MDKKELLERRIEQERKKLNCLVEEKGKTEETYSQSLLLDRLIEQYLEMAGYRNSMATK